MKIQWYPGHMHKAGKEMRKILPSVDLVIEILDARIPFSSENPMLAQIRGDKPRIKILNKRDLADDATTALWREHFQRQNNIHTLALSMRQPDEARALIPLCRQLAAKRLKSGRSATAMIMGIPNVGKSTLINTLTGKTIAKTGNEPAVTKGQQRIELARDLTLLDTPGMLWPNVENRDSGYRLAVTGAIRDTAITHEDVASYAAEYLLAHYPDRLRERYAMTALPDSDYEFLLALGRQRGCLRPGGEVDLDKVAKLLLNEIRGGKLGGLTFETPEMIAREMEIVAEERRQREARKAARKQKRKKNKR